MILSDRGKYSIFQRFLILTLIFVLANAAIIIAIDRYCWTKIAELRQRILFQRINLENTINRELYAKKLNDKLEQIEPVLANFDQIFISRNRELEFITTLESAAVRNRVDQKISLDINTAQTVSGYQKTPVELMLTGSYDDVVLYLSELEALSYYINIRSLDFSSGAKTQALSESAALPSITLKINADTYWR